MKEYIAKEYKYTQSKCKKFSGDYILYSVFLLLPENVHAEAGRKHIFVQRKKSYWSIRVHR